MGGKGNESPLTYLGLMRRPCPIPSNLYIPLIVDPPPLPPPLPPPSLHPEQVEQALVLALMRLREKVGARSTPGTSAKDRKKRGNLGEYTRTLWSSLGEGGGTDAGHRGAGGDGESSVGPGVRYASGTGGEGGGGSKETRSRLLAFAGTLASGESALSPGVFDVEGVRRAEVRTLYGEWEGGRRAARGTLARSG